MHIKVADINVTDDALGTEALSLTGADAASFEIVGSSLYLKAGVTLNYEAKASYNVTVTPTIRPSVRRRTFRKASLLRSAM